MEMVEIVVSFLAGACAGVNLTKGICSWIDADKTGACVDFICVAIYAGFVVFLEASL